MGDEREREEWVVEENREYEEGDDRKFCSFSVGILLTKFVADILQNLFLTDLVIWKIVYCYIIVDDIEGQRYVITCALCRTMF